MISRPPLIHVGPLPDARNGIADYSAGLLEMLAPLYQLVCVTHDPQSVAPRIGRLAHVMSFEDYERQGAALRSMRHLYHVGNNPDHVAVLDMLWSVPGTVVLHDLTLHYLLERWSEQTFGRLDAMTDVVRHLHGSDAAALTIARYRLKMPVQSVFHELDGLPALQTCARSIITHSHLGRVRLVASGYRGPVATIPHFAFSPPKAVRDRLRHHWRARLGARNGTVLLASLGFVSPAKQIGAVLRTLADLSRDLVDWRYVIGGEDRDPEVRQLCTSLGLGDRVIFLDYLEDTAFDGVLAAADLLINLRFPTSGETSGTASRALAYGLPILVSDHGWYAELPDSVVYRVAPSAQPDAALHRALCIALTDPGLRAEKASAALTYAERHLAPDTIALSYRDAIEAGQSAALPPAARPERALITVLPAPRRAGTRETGSLDTCLSEILASEHAHINGHAALPVMLRGPFSLKAPLAEIALAGKRQVFAAIEARGLIGGIIATTADAAAATQPGDLFTLAVVSDTPETVSDRQWHGDALSFGLSLRGQIEAALDEAGFGILRITETVATPANPGDRFCRIVTATARRITLEGFARAYAKSQ